LALHDNLPFVHHNNIRLDGIKISRWIYSKPCTGKDKLEEFKAFCFDKGFMGSMVICVDASQLQQTVVPVPKTGFKVRPMGV
jgi:hypothetical protein